MNSKFSKTVLLIFLGILLIGFATLVWAVQTGKITISANIAPPIINLSATAISENQINLSWSAPASHNGTNLQKYVLRSGQDPNGSVMKACACAPVEYYVGKGTSFEHMGLQPGRTYYYELIAYYDYSGNNLRANASAKTKPSTDKITFKAEVISDSQINLSWSAPQTHNNGNLNNYTLARVITECPKFADCYVDSLYEELYTGKGTSFEHKNLKPNTTYSYRITANYSAGNITNKSLGNYLQEYLNATTKQSTGACAKENEIALNIENNQKKQCCEGLKEISDCDLSGTDASGNTTCKPVDCNHICTKCGDGVCGPHENSCNCPDDCKGCVGLGGNGPNPSLGPNDPNKDKKCCGGLEALAPKTAFSTQGSNECTPSVGSATMCIACGDGVCDSNYENKCNCPKDCNPNKPSPPTNIKASATGQNSIKITWNGMSKDKVKKFTVHLNPPIGDVDNPGEGQSASFEATGLTCGTNYSFYIISKNDSGESAPSEKASATTNNCSPGQGPTPSPTSSPSGGVISNLGKLVSTGSNLWINIVIALIGTAAIGYFIFRKDIWK